MIIGVARETQRHEHRVALTPFAVANLTEAGHEVVMESGAGTEAHFEDADFTRAGARLVYQAEEVFRRADVVCRIEPPAMEEIDMLRPGSIAFGFYELAVAPREKVERILENGVTAIGWEMVQDEKGDRPVLRPLADMAGRMAVTLAAYYLQIEQGGRGILLGNVPGVPPATVLILGAGAVGRAAAREAVASGAHVIMIDAEYQRLHSVHREFGGRVVTAVAGLDRLEKFTPIADVVIGAVHVPGARAPFVVTEEMVRAMKPGSVIFDISIDQGGCVETSRPTSVDHPTFIVHDVIHYCVPNMTATIARTASRALVNAALPYVRAVADHGLERALREDPGLAAGVYALNGKLVNAHIGQSLGLPATPVSELIGSGGITS